MKTTILFILFTSLTLGQRGFSPIYEDGFTPSQVSGLQLWFDATKGITASSWLDQSGNNRTMTLYNSPIFGTQNGKATVIFNGTNEYGKVANFTLNDPIIIYIVFRQVTWTANDYIIDGATDQIAYLYQHTSTPKILFRDASAALTDIDFTLNTFGIIKGVYANGTNAASVQLNDGTPITGTLGTTAMGGFTLARPGTTNSAFSNIEVCEIIVYNATVSSSNNTKIKTYLYSKWGITP